MSPGCTYVAPSVLGEMTLTREEASRFFLRKAQLYKGEKKFFLLIAQVKNTHLNKNKSICNGKFYTNSTFVIGCEVSLGS